MKSLQHKDQKVAVLIDVQNLYYSAKHMYNSKVNFKEILKTAVAGRRFIRAIAYVIEADIKGEETFHKALESIGIEVKSKGLQKFIGGAKKGDWDIGLAMDAVRLASKVDTIVIVSGDGDFKELLLYLKAQGCRTEVIAFSKTASKLIKDEADMFFDMEVDKKKYLLKDKQTSLKKSYKKPAEKQEPPKLEAKKSGSVSVPK
ncbi:NYN domain-containing protein [Candidatus Woesearchaeota archaeon]|nr:NYN domain-containing protein [Candidatus Woesearchaeota archaeon]